LIGRFGMLQGGGISHDEACQNCTTRESEMRDCTLPLGLDQSVGSMGSHTTRTRRSAD